MRATKAGLPAAGLALRAGKPFARRRLERGFDELADASHLAGRLLATEGPRIAYELGLAEPPKPRRLAPRVAAGALIGASAMYLLEPGHGREHREQLARLVG